MNLMTLASESEGGNFVSSLRLLPAHQVNGMLSIIDKDGDGSLSVGELLMAVKGACTRLAMRAWLG